MFKNPSLSRYFKMPYIHQQVTLKLYPSYSFSCCQRVLSVTLAGMMSLYLQATRHGLQYSRGLLPSLWAVMWN